MTRIFHWFFYVKDGSYVRLRHPSCVYIKAQRSTLQYKRCVHLWNNFPCISTLFQTINYVRSNNLNLKYQKSKSSGCQDIGIRKLNLWQRLNRLNSFPNISVNFKGKNFVDQILEIPRLLNCDTAELCLQNISHGTKTTSISELVI